MARAAEAACGLHQILFVPAAHPWHKTPPVAGYADRYAMLALALQHHPRWRPLDLAQAEAVESATYSIDQLRRLHRLYPSAQLHFIVGADALATLPSWKQPERLLRLCDFIVLGRAGFAINDMMAVLPARLRARRGAGGEIELAGGTRLHWVERFRAEESSTAARRWLAAPVPSPPAPVPAAVAAYARRSRIYKYV